MFDRLLQKVEHLVILTIRREMGKTSLLFTRRGVVLDLLEFVLATPRPIVDMPGS